MRLFCTIVLFIFITVFSYSSSLFLSKMSIEQGFNLNKVDNLKYDLNSSNSINAYFAYKDYITKDIMGLFVYNFDYSGPGIKGGTANNFTSRTLDNFFLSKFFYPLDNQFTLEFKADFLYEFYNTGSEKWTEGLYNFGKVSLGSDISYKKNDIVLRSGVGLSYVWFPNYTDLETEALNMIEGNFASSINQNFIQLSLNLGFELNSSFNLVIDYFLLYRFYPDLYINSESILDKEKQYDLINVLKIEFGFDFKKTYLNIGSNLSYYNSNYNYRKIVDFSTLKIDFNKDYLDYINLDTYFQFGIYVSSSSVLEFNPYLGYKKYFKRHPLKNDGSGELDFSKLEYDLYYGASLSYNYITDEVLSFKPVYTIQKGVSNNKYIMSGGNYISHYIGFKVSFEY